MTFSSQRFVRWMRWVAFWVTLATAVRALPEGEVRPVSFEVDGQWIGNGVSFSPYRAGQAPGGVTPSKAQLRQDLQIVQRHWSLIRLYGSGELAQRTLEVIREDQLPIRVILGAWIASEDTVQGQAENRAEVSNLIRLANAFRDEVMAVNVGNESLVFWSGHRVTPELLIGYLREVRAAVKQPVTTADDYKFWIDPAAESVAAEVDFIMLHAYALWNGRSLEEAMAWTGGIYDQVTSRFPGRPVVLAETGWATQHDPTKTGDGQEGALMQAEVSVATQAEYLQQHYAWVDARRVPNTLFEAFDEPWKGSGPDGNPAEAEKHWGVFDQHRQPKVSFLELLEARYPQQAHFYATGTAAAEAASPVAQP